MRKKITVLTAGVCAAAMLLTGCSSEISNEYVTISQYKGIEVEKVEVQEVTDEEVESEIQYMLECYAEYNDITDRAAQLGDTVTIAYVGKLDGEAFDGGTSESYDLELGSGTFIDGFEDGIVGHEIGDEFDLELTFPEDYGSTDLAGQDVVFEVTLNAITEVNIPELTDEWVQEVSETSTTVDEYRTEKREELETYYAESAESEMKSAVWEQFLENTTVDQYPTEELQELIAKYQSQYEEWAESYNMEFEEFLESYMGMDEDTFNSEVSTAAKDQIKETYAVNLVIEKEKIDVSEEKLMPVYEEYAEYFGYETVDELKAALEEAGTLDSLEQLGRAEVLQDWLLENAKLVEAEESSEE